MAIVQTGKLFSCGNHSLEETKGMLHFGDPSQVVCIIGVPTTMTVRDVIQFLRPSMDQIENSRILREVNYDSSYIVLLTFRNEEAAKDFYLHHDGVKFNSLEDHTCKLLYVTRIETFANDPAKMEETPNCAVCLDRMYEDVESIITILCNHSFHAHCLSKWSDTSCPVCRYCQTPECQVENKCMDCSYEGESLWMCITCGYVACGRYIDGHAYNHFSQTQHTYAMQLTDNQVWDYAGDNYVHRLIANKTDGKPVEVEGADAHRQADEKIEAVQLEYTYLLTQQLESQRKYYEGLLKDCNKQSQKKIKELIRDSKTLADELSQLNEKHQQTIKEKNATDRKLQSTQAKLTKSQAALAEERQMNKCLSLNQEQLVRKQKALEEELNEKLAEINELKMQQRDMMFYIESRDTIDKTIHNEDISQTEIDNSQIIITEKPTSSHQSTFKNNRKKKR